MSSIFALPLAVVGPEASYPAVTGAIFSCDLHNNLLESVIFGSWIIISGVCIIGFQHVFHPIFSHLALCLPPLTGNVIVKMQFFPNLSFSLGSFRHSDIDVESLFHKRGDIGPSTVAQACNPSYSGG